MFVDLESGTRDGQRRGYTPTEAADGHSHHDQPGVVLLVGGREAPAANGFELVTQHPWIGQRGISVRG